MTVINTPCVLTTHAKLTQDITEVCQSSTGSTLSVDFTNVHIVAMRSEDSDFESTTSSVDWFVSDSQVLTWAISWLGGKKGQHERVYGPDFLDYFVRNGDPMLTHYFFGASQECLDKLLIELKKINPELKIAGSRNGYFKDADNPRIVDDINESNADVLWVGLGTPKQQAWINQHKGQLKVGAALAVGFAFDVNAGTKTDAPKFLGPLGLTWLYRLAAEPRRLWHRYTHYNWVFIRDLYRSVNKA
ncbi:hypothetical protein BSZ32_05975 [Rubritalea profundi]|uniref:Glycosyltransferase n=1 Tax=Rubritalea profundi TaxID=1658618 RepID=A0A2S7U7L2_9BACT|nr:hypothetical protein BSZ32_05975 [Rubritalea profundi]